MALVTTRWSKAGGGRGCPGAAVGPDAASFLEYIHIVSGTWSAAFDVGNVIFLIATSEDNNKPVCFPEAAGYIQSLCCHKAVFTLLSVTT